MISARIRTTAAHGITFSPISIDRMRSHGRCTRYSKLNIRERQPYTCRTLVSLVIQLSCVCFTNSSSDLASRPTSGPTAAYDPGPQPGAARRGAAACFALSPSCIGHESLQRIFTWYGHTAAVQKDSSNDGNCALLIRRRAVAARRGSASSPLPCEYRLKPFRGCGRSVCAPFHRTAASIPS